MRTPTESQWDAIRAVDRHVLVAAGAGTGKTTTVVGRILYCLGLPIRGARVATPMGLHELAAITFTNAAAADLSRRLTQELREAGRPDLAVEVNAARIGTIHGFCGDVLREFALRAGRHPSPRILEEGEAAALAAEAVRETVLDALAGGAIEGLALLFEERSIAEVERWLVRLMDDGDRLRRLVRHRDDHPDAERALLDLAVAALARLEERLGDAGAVDFDRMITWTRDLLRDRPEARGALQRRLRVLIVDEFQDVDPAQKEIAYLLGAPAEDRPDTTRLLLVGDPKQSIYRFRRADVTVWRDVERDFEAGHGDVVTLVENFRSVPPVLAFVDAVIGPILDQPLDGIAHRDFEIGFRSVRATQREGPADLAVELLLTPPTDEGRRRPVAEVRDHDAAALARRAVELHEEGVAWKEMAVLLSAWTMADHYEEHLRRLGVPTYAFRTEGFYARREVLDLVLALEAVRDPRDDRALLGFLRSPFVGLRDETLLDVCRQLRAPLWDRLPDVTVAEADRLDAGRRLLETHVLLRDRIPAHELLESLLEESGYLGHLLLRGEGGRRAFANVRKFVGQARRLAGHSIGEILRMIAGARRGRDAEGEARLYGEHDDVLTITTVHSAKGLEWPVVFWAELNRGPYTEWMAGLMTSGDRLLLDVPGTKAADQPPAWQELRALDEAQGTAERKRLWYVAATRPKHRLILTGLPLGSDRDDGSPAAAVRRTLGDIPAGGETLSYRGHDGRDFRATVRSTLVAPLPPAMAPAGPEGEVPTPAPALVVRPGRLRHSATELLTHARCPRRHWLKYLVGLREPDVAREGPAFLSAVTRGLIVHDVLEHLQEEAELDRLLEEAIGRWDPEAPPPDAAAGRRYRGPLRTEIASVWDHPDYRSVADRPTARRELPFLHLVGPDGATEGQVDLAAITEEGYVLVDVKTGRVSAEAVEAKARQYLPQRDVYVGATEAIAGAPVASFAFHFSQADAHFAEPVTAEERAAGRARLDQALATLGAGEPPLTSFPAECRFCGYRVAGWCPGVGEDG